MHRGDVMKLRVKLIGRGTPDDPIRVNFPTYIMITGTERPDSVVVELPNEYFEKPRSLKENIRRIYRGQPQWDRDDYEPEKEILEG